MGLDEALSLTVIVPDIVPCDFGINITLMVQLVAAAIFAWQVVVTPNCALALMDEILSAVFAVLVSVTSRTGLFVPTACFLKTIGLAGENATVPVFNSTMTSFE